jgi:PPOX class probable F420-dependent enzyme
LPSDARTRFAGARVARLATVGRDGRPRVVPCCFALAGDVLYTAVDAKPKTTTALARVDDVRHRPDVALVVDHYDDDWTQLWWVRVRGRARVVDNDEERTSALALLAAKYAQYRAAPPPGPVIAVAIDEWRSWDPQVSGSQMRQGL